MKTEAELKKGLCLVSQNIDFENIEAIKNTTIDYVLKEIGSCSECRYAFDKSKTHCECKLYEHWRPLLSFYCKSFQRKGDKQMKSLEKPTEDIADLEQRYEKAKERADFFCEEFSKQIEHTQFVSKQLSDLHRFVMTKGCWVSARNMVLDFNPNDVDDIIFRDYGDIGKGDK